MGSRFSPRIPGARERDQKTRPSDRAGADGDRYALGARRHPASARDRTRQADRARVRPAESRSTKRARRNKAADKFKILTSLFTGDDALEGTGIIYTATIKNALEVQHHLTHELNIPAAVYHSKLHKEDRTSVQNLFMGEAIRAVVATNAFGLGIDKSNIRFVVHYDLTGSLEAYTQEAGRAGRDGLRVALHSHLSDERYARAKLFS